MMKKKRLSLVAITVSVVVSLLMLPLGCLSIPVETGEPASNGTEAPNVPNASSEAAETPAPEVEDENIIFLSKRGYISAAGCPTILGKVTNVGNFTVKDILIMASFYCSKGKLIGEKDDMSAITTGYTELEILAPGETSPYKIALSSEKLSLLPNFDVDKVEKYTVVVSNYNATDEEPLCQAFEISQSSAALSEPTGQYIVTGTVINAGNETAEQIKVIGTFYDSQDRIIEVAHIYLQEALPPAEETGFEITVPDVTISQRIETCRLQAVGA